MRSDRVSAHQQGLSYARHISLAVTGTDGEQVALYGVPVRLRTPGLFFDVNSDAVLAVPTDGDTSRQVAYNMQAGVTGSLLEGMAWQTLLGESGPGVSTVSVICQALQTGIPVCQIDATNVESRLAALALPAEIEDEMSASVAQGNIVVTPEQQVTIGDWQGCGYMLMDPDTGNAQYLISGGLSGGISPWGNIGSFAALSAAILALSTAVDPITSAAVSLTIAALSCIAIEDAYYQGVAAIREARLAPDREDYYIGELAAAAHCAVAAIMLGAIYGATNRVAGLTIALAMACVAFAFVYMTQEWLPWHLGLEKEMLGWPGG